MYNKMICSLVVLSFVLTWILRRYALATRWLDIPNHRSSHTLPTPKGGGLAFILCFILLIVCLVFEKKVSSMLALALLVPGIMVAFLGFCDDKRSIPAAWRLGGHFFCCGVALYLLGGMPPISLMGVTMPTGILQVLGLIYLVWLLNLFNFMDGINGIAAIEAISVGFGGALIYFLHAKGLALLIPLGLACSVLGFLFWNFPLARIFMGDVGSGFLGYVLGILSLQAALEDPAFFWSWLILLGVFIVDASLTLLQRAISCQSLFTSHCTHAYQYASRRYSSHSKVSLAVLVINLLWLLPLALGVSFHIVDGFLALLIAYAPLIFLARYFKAGKVLEQTLNTL